MWNDKCAAPGCPYRVPKSRRFQAIYCSVKCERRMAARRRRRRLLERQARLDWDAAGRPDADAPD